MAFGSKRGHGDCRWSDVPWSECAEVLAACADSGALITLGRSRDGGAISVGYVQGGNKDRDWCSSPDEVPDMLYELAKVLGVNRPPLTAQEALSAPQASSTPVARRGRSKPS